MKILESTLAISIALAASGAFADQVVKIGYAGPLTGAIAHIGKDSQYGAQLAIDEANEQNIKIKGESVQFVLDVQDDQGDPKTAVTVAQKLVDDHIVGLVGHINSGATLATSKVYSDAGIAQISPSSTNPMFTRQRMKTTFRTIGDDRDVADALVGYVVDTLKAKQVVVVDDRTAFGQAFSDAAVESLARRGITPVGREYTTDQAVDFRGILTNLKSKQPQVLIYGGVDAQAAISNAPPSPKNNAAGLRRRRVRSYIRVILASPGTWVEAAPDRRSFALSSQCCRKCRCRSVRWRT